ncbi:MAG: 2,3-bisphosphoglycerate-independent phosphoglycerate mutase, partial [Halobacteria archaeon]|nr:2,3-bisphosphoglycerate-independent phosphoglycerate mutase [Halobacteria archaeon]
MTKAALIILDGWAERSGGDASNRNAVADADTPNVDRLKREGKTGLLKTYGRSVGLVEGQMGNSEVGHLNIGAGRIVKQPLARIDDDIEDGSFFDNEALLEAMKSDGRLHFMGLVSDGGVHSAIRHLYALLVMAYVNGRRPIIHAFLDGRDTAPRKALEYITSLQEKTDETGAEIATVSGRYYAMDRDEQWDRTKLAYDAIVNRKGNLAEDAVQAV